jgi:hypothetical protein
MHLVSGKKPGPMYKGTTHPRAVVILLNYNMPRKVHLEDVLEFTRLAVSTARELSVSAKVPFLGGACVLGVEIVDIIGVGPRHC